MAQTKLEEVVYFEAADKYVRVLTEGHEYLMIRDEAGKLHLQLRGRKERLPVSRLYAHLFKAL